MIFISVGSKEHRQLSKTTDSLGMDMSSLEMNMSEQATQLLVRTELRNKIFGIKSTQKESLRF